MWNVGHDGVVLALPSACPLQALAFEDASSMDVQRVAVSAPLLQSPLSFGLRGTPAAEARLGICVLLDEMLVEPVSVRTLLAWEVDWAVGS